MFPTRIRWPVLRIRGAQQGVDDHEDQDGREHAGHRRLRRRTAVKRSAYCALVICCIGIPQPQLAVIVANPGPVPVALASRCVVTRLWQDEQDQYTVGDGNRWRTTAAMGLLGGGGMVRTPDPDRRQGILRRNSSP